MGHARRAADVVLLGLALISAPARAADLGRAGLALRYAKSISLYEQSQTRVEVEPGRFVHLICMGQGSPTVVLGAGGAAWSSSWVFVQPELAKTTRVCAWDRAGNGFSSASGEPQDVAHTERDLERALDGAGVSGPMVMVGHSMGAFEALLFTDRRRERVAGLVLVDPSYPGQEEALARAAPGLMAWSAAGDKKALDGVRQCASMLEANSTSSPPEACERLRGRQTEVMRKALAGLTADPAYWRTYLSDFEMRARNSQLTLDAGRSYADLPVVVLEAGKLDLNGAPAAAQAEAPALKAEIAAGRRRTLGGLSTRVSFVAVPKAGHAIMLDEPDAVVQAVLGLVTEARKGR